MLKTFYNDQSSHDAERKHSNIRAVSEDFLIVLNKESANKTYLEISFPISFQTN